MVAFDIALRFRVSILDVITGEEITDLVDIRRKQLRSFVLYIDILTIIPFEIIRQGEILILVGLIKLHHIGRVKIFINNMNVKSNIKLVRLFLLF
jgi:hypothetical protein